MEAFWWKAGAFWIDQRIGSWTAFSWLSCAICKYLVNALIALHPISLKRRKSAPPQVLQWSATGWTMRTFHSSRLSYRSRYIQSIQWKLANRTNIIAGGSRQFFNSLLWNYSIKSIKLGTIIENQLKQSYLKNTENEFKRKADDDLLLTTSTMQQAVLHASVVELSI